jgi:L-lactate dehydrogenase complex protein LldG
MSVFSEYKQEIMDAAHNDRVRLALSRAILSYRANVNEALKRFPHTIEMAKEVREIKKRSISEMEKLAAQACESIEYNKGKAYIAKTVKDCLDIVDKLVGSSKLIVKSKSMTSEEIDLRDHLERQGNEVYETDLGEFIIQKLHSRPMHILSPAVHVPKEDVAKLFSEITGEKIPADIATLVGTARKLLREKFILADVGISGSNVVAADTGTLFVIENEGNARLATGLPPIHIAIVGMEKLVPTLHDAYKVAEVTWRYANYTVPGYVSLISSPSKTGDIEKVTTYGAHGPKELHVIFLDAGRTQLAKNPILSQAMYCLRCGGCLYECPVFALTAGHFGDKYFTANGAVWAATLSGNPEKAAAVAYTCLTCRRCKVRCPVEIDGPAMTVEVRRLVTEGKQTEAGS